MILSFLLAASVSAFEATVTVANVGTVFNGLGAVPSTLNRTADAPMRYRVLVPWLLALWAWFRGINIREFTSENGPPLYRFYLGIRFGLTWALVALLLPYGLPFTVAFLCCYLLCIRYDYWSHLPELIGLLLVHQGDLGSIFLGSVLWGLSRETVALAPLIPLVLGNPIGAVVAVSGLFVRKAVVLFQGSASLYCERWTFETYNLHDLQRLDIFAWLPLVFLAWALNLALDPAVLGITLIEPWAATAWVPVVYLIAAWAMARVVEWRTFLPAALWFAASLPVERERVVVIPALPTSSSSCPVPPPALTR